MIRHIVLFKLKPGRAFDDPEVIAAERMAQQVGDEVPQLLHWRVGRNVSSRDIAYDFAAIGVVANAVALQEYLDHPFHRQSANQWRVISDWIVADIEEDNPGPLQQVFQA